MFPLICSSLPTYYYEGYNNGSTGNSIFFVSHGLMNKITEKLNEDYVLFAQNVPVSEEEVMTVGGWKLFYF